MCMLLLLRRCCGRDGAIQLLLQLVVFDMGESRLWSCVYSPPQAPRAAHPPWTGPGLGEGLRVVGGVYSSFVLGWCSSNLLVNGMVPICPCSPDKNTAMTFSICVWCMLEFPAQFKMQMQTFNNKRLEVCCCPIVKRRGSHSD